MVLQEIVIRLCAGDSRRALKPPILNTKMVGGEGFEPSSSRSRTAIALGSVRVARGRLGSGRPLLRSAKCRHVTADAAWIATCVATRFPTTAGARGRNDP